MTKNVTNEKPAAATVLTDERIIEICAKNGLGPCLGMAVGRAIEAELLAHAGKAVAADEKHLPGWECGIATVTLSGHQLRAALEIINLDGDEDPDQFDDDLTFGVVQHRGDDGKVSTGMCCWNDDTEGVLPLDGEYEAKAAPVAPAAAGIESLERFDVVLRGGSAFMEADKIGWWVRYSDVERLLAQAGVTAEPAVQDQCDNPLPPQDFIDYVTKNYKGDIFIADPAWHALRLWNAAMRSAKSAAPTIPAQVPVAEVRAEDLKAIEDAVDVLDAFGNLPDGMMHPGPWNSRKAEDKIKAAREAISNLHSLAHQSTADSAGTGAMGEGAERE